MRRITYLTIVALFAVLGFTSFAQENTPVPTTGLAEPGAGAYVRFAHFAPQMESVDILIDGQPTDLTTIAYGDVTEWSPITPGTYQIDVVSSGGAETAALTLSSVNFAENTFQTVIIYGSLENQTLNANVIAENYTELLPQTGRVVFFNAVPNTAVNFTRDDVAFAVNLGTQAQSNYTIIPMDATSYMFGITDTADDSTLLEPQEVEIVDGNTYLMVYTGDLDAPELRVFEIDPAEIAIATGVLEEPGTIVEAAQAYDILAPFAQAIESAGLSETLSGEGPYTVFVPADYVLDDALTQYDSEALADILRNHVVEGEIRFSDVLDAGSLTALSGQELTFTESDQGAFVNDIQITRVNIPATNGTIHVIDGVITGE